MKRLLYSLLLLGMSLGMAAQEMVVTELIPPAAPEPTEQDLINAEIFDRVYEGAKSLAHAPMPVLITEIAQQFIGTPYVAHTLEEKPEELRVFLDKTDCILFVELCSSFALTVKGLRIVQAGEGKYWLNEMPSVEKDTPSLALLCHNIQNMRYRAGKVDGYASRIHYTSEWILQNQTNGLMQEYSGELGEKYEQKFFFMTSHPQQYDALQDPEQLAAIREVEQHLNEQEPYAYISHERLQDPEVMVQIQSGDIVCFMSKQGKGIDIAHVAIAFAVGEEMHFIHASYSAKEVKIEETPLAEYATNGIRIVRWNEELNNY